MRGGITPDHPSVAATFSLAFQKVVDRSPAAADLIRACAFLAPDAIPEEIFTAGAAELGEHLGPLAPNLLAFMEVLKEAGRFSLIERDPATKVVNIHRLVQEVLKDEMDESMLHLWAERTVRALNRVFPDVEFLQWPLCERLLPHVQTCAELIKGYNFEFSETARLLNQAGSYLYERAQYPQAEPLYQRALAIREKVLGPNHPDTATSLNNLAGLYKTQGFYTQAEPLYQQALAIYERVLGPNHPQTANSLNNLAALYRTQGLYAKAEPLYQRALATREKSLGPEHPDVAISLENYAALLRNMNRKAEAENLETRAQAIREKQGWKT